MEYYNLSNKKYIKEEDKSKSLSFLYNNLIGRILLKVATSKIISRIYALYMNSKLSTLKIKKFIKKNNIDISEYKEKKYKSFNEFFMREIKEDKRKINNGLIAIADSKLSVYKIDENLKLNIKNSIYTVDELIGEDASNYKDGYALIYRLCVDDYHHYIFPDDGKIVKTKKIKGILHTVRPIALKKYKVFSENSREVTILDTKNYGRVAYIEVGAMMIGKIVNNDLKTFKKGEDKGHFEFGGSTVILLYQKNKININKVIEDNSKNDIETIVKMGENIE